MQSLARQIKNTDVTDATKPISELLQNDFW